MLVALLSKRVRNANEPRHTALGRLESDDGHRLDLVGRPPARFRQLFRKRAQFSRRLLRAAERNNSNASAIGEVEPLHEHPNGTLDYHPRVQRRLSWAMVVWQLVDLACLSVGMEGQARDLSSRASPRSRGVRPWQRRCSTTRSAHWYGSTLRAVARNALKGKPWPGRRRDGRARGFDDDPSRAQIRRSP